MAQTRIKVVSASGTFEAVVGHSSAEIQKIARALRGLIADVLPGVTEVPWSKQRNVGYGIGPRKMSEHFCYIFPHKDYVNLGFMQGAKLSDPNGLLQGNGRLLRHVKVRSLTDATNPALRALVKKAVARLRG